MEVKLDDEITLIGVADLIIKEGNKVKIIDYKTGQKIEMHAKYDASKKQKKSFKYPMSHIEDSKYNEYEGHPRKRHNNEPWEEDDDRYMPRYY